jgi:enoyl-CoA hydratase/carnithine racemase
MRIIDPRTLQLADRHLLDGLLAAREMVVAAGEEEVRGLPAAALLLSDYAVLSRDAVLLVDAPEAWAGAVWRLGRRALPLALLNGRMTAGEAVGAGLCDAVLEEPFEEWLASWMEGRSVTALDSAAILIRSHGGDRLEAAEFARLFATGAPQDGMRAFLERRRG